MSLVLFITKAWHRICAVGVIYGLYGDKGKENGIRVIGRYRRALAGGMQKMTSTAREDLVSPMTQFLLLVAYSRLPFTWLAREKSRFASQVHWHVESPNVGVLR